MADDVDIAKIAEQRDLAVARATRALALLGRVVQIVGGIGGYMAPEHQAVLREAMSELVDAGAVVRVEQEWRDREYASCGCAKFGFPNGVHGRNCDQRKGATP